MKKYTKGEQITSLDDFINQKVIYVRPWGKASNIAFLQNWQIHLVKKWIDKGFFYFAEISKDLIEGEQ